jgi:ABC-type nitrate/sulfonate/bicarbonate transport system permease component
MSTARGGVAGLGRLPRAPDRPARAARARDRDGAAAHPAALKASAGAAILVAWELVVRAAGPAYVARPSTIALAAPQVLANAAFLGAARATLGAVLLGLAVSVAAGTLTGLAMGRVRLVDWALRYHVSFLYAVPMVAILPLMTLWFGYSGGARLAVVVFASFLGMALAARDGACAVPADLLEVARSFRARWHHVLFGVTLPASLPHLFAGIHLAAGRALVAAVVAEFFIAIDGLGSYILLESRSYRHDRAFVAVLALALVAVAVEYGMRSATRRFMRWTGR